MYCAAYGQCNKHSWVIRELLYCDSNFKWLVSVCYDARKKHCICIQWDKRSQKTTSFLWLHSINWLCSTIPHLGMAQVLQMLPDGNFPATIEKNYNREDKDVSSKILLWKWKESVPNVQEILHRLEESFPVAMCRGEDYFTTGPSLGVAGGLVWWYPWWQPTSNLFLMPGHELVV